MSSASRLFRTHPAAALFLAALFFRVVFFLIVQPWDPEVERQVVFQVDAFEYHKIAMDIVCRHQFTLSFEAFPDGVRTPVYPFYVATVYALFGAKPFLPILFQLFLDSLACVLLFLICRKFLSQRASLFAAALYAVDPYCIYYANTLLSESLLILALLAGVYALSPLFERSEKYPGVRPVLLAGLLFGISALIKPITFYLVILVPVILFFLWRKRENALRYPLIFIMAFLLTLSPWFVRNYILYGTPEFSTSSSFNLMSLTVIPFVAEQEKSPVKDVFTRLFAEADTLAVKEGKNIGAMSPFEKASYWQRISLRYISKYPAMFVKDYVFGIVHLFIGLESREFAKGLHFKATPEDPQLEQYVNPLQRNTTWSTAKNPGELAVGLTVAGYLLLCYILIIFGMKASYTDRQKVLALFCIAITVYFILITGAAGRARFRLPFMPFLFVFAGMGAEVVWGFVMRSVKKGSE